MQISFGRYTVLSNVMMENIFKFAHNHISLLFMPSSCLWAKGCVWNTGYCCMLCTTNLCCCPSHFRVNRVESVFFDLQPSCCLEMCNHGNPCQRFQNSWHLAKWNFMPTLSEATLTLPQWSFGGRLPLSLTLLLSSPLNCWIYVLLTPFFLNVYLTN